jgi:hypothetical protein
MLPWSAPLAGRFEELVVDSAALRGNPLGDPHERPLMVYLPPGYDHDDSRRYPSVYVAQGYTGHLAMWWNRSAGDQRQVQRRLRGHGDRHAAARGVRCAGHARR